MSFDIFKKALDQFIQMGGSDISLTPIVGDPLIDPNLMEKIGYALETGKIKKIYFYSNGILLLKNDAYKKLIDSGLSNIEISNAFVDDYYAVRPGDDIDVYTKVKNIGNVNENIVVRARLENSGNIEDSVNFELNEKAAGRWNLLSLKVPYSAKKGEQIVKITAITSKETVVKYITFDI